MNENDFWVVIWKIIGACFCILVLTVGGCVGYIDTRIINAPDPIAASCAVAFSTPACVIAQRK
jgi:hypothetical protein